MYRKTVIRLLLVPLAMVLAARRTLMHHRGRTGRKERTVVVKTRQVALMVGAALAATVAVPSHASAMSQVPFRATVAEIDRGEAFCPTTQTRYLCVTLTGTGQATQLGTLQESAVVVVDLSTAGVAGPGCASELRTSTLTAAHGDQVTLQGPGQACGDSHHATALDLWVVTARTGRFAGATGSGFNVASIDRNSTPVTSVTTFSGTISSPGSL
ncbi:MAG TPA: hypothetical protein VF898_11090 [Chloroflexota bacterium]